jgi:hypothetical protein
MQTMNKLIIALVAGTFATVAAAQAPKATTAEKQKEVDAATKAGTDSTATMAREQKGVQDAKAAKGTPKDLPTKADKQKAVDAATKAGSDATATMAAEQKGVAEAKAAKGTPKDLPTKADKQKAVDAATAAAAKKGSN